MFCRDEDSSCNREKKSRKEESGWRGGGEERNKGKIVSSNPFFLLVSECLGQLTYTSTNPLRF